MNDKEKATIFESLKKCEQIIAESARTAGEPEEAEVRSINNERLAIALSEFGSYVADVIDMTQKQKDYLDQLFESEKIRRMDGGESATKAESLVKTDLEFMGQLTKLRSLQRSENVLKRKEKSMYSILDQSRSRLSLVNKDRAN